MKLESWDRRLQHARIYLDGVRQRFVRSADDREGYVERYRTENGVLCHCAGMPQIERIHGHVRIELGSE